MICIVCIIYEYKLNRDDDDEDDEDDWGWWGGGEGRGRWRRRRRRWNGIVDLGWSNELLVQLYTLSSLISLSATIFKATWYCSHDPRMMVGLPLAVEILHLLLEIGRGADGVCHTLLDEFGMIQPWLLLKTAKHDLQGERNWLKTLVRSPFRGLCQVTKYMFFWFLLKKYTIYHHISILRGIMWVTRCYKYGC